MDEPHVAQVEQGGLATPPMPVKQPPRWTALLVLILAITPIWAGLGWMPVSARSDGRYAAVSLDMAQHNHWLIPQRYNQPHLTKPPLIYWAEAGSIKLFGANEFAVRFPSALAGSLVIGIAMLLAWRRYGLRVGLLAAALLAVMPLHLVVSRLTLTDAVLNLFWFLSLVGGLMTVREPGRLRWPILLCAGVALGWLTKPLAPWGAVGILGVWLILQGRWKALVWPALAAVLAVIPIGIWFYLVWRSAPDIVEVWQREVGERAAGVGRHEEPFWYYIPVFFAGLFPATAMLEIPGVSRPWRSAWQSLRKGTDGALWALAMVMPVLAFSIPEGKLATYILPAAPAAALLTALMLDGWLNGAHERASTYSPPEVRGTIMIVLCILAIGGAVVPAFLSEGRYWWAGMPALLVAAAGIYQWRGWDRGPRFRGRAMTLVWVSIIAVSTYGLLLAGHLWRPHGGAALVRAVREKIDVTQPNVVTFGHRDYAQSFYWQQWAPPVEYPDDMKALVEEHGRNLIVIADDERWNEWSAIYRNRIGDFDKVMTWQRWPSQREFLILQPRGEP